MEMNEAIRLLIKKRELILADLHAIERSIALLGGTSRYLGIKNQAATLQWLQEHLGKHKVNDVVKGLVEEGFPRKEHLAPAISGCLSRLCSKGVLIKDKVDSVTVYAWKES